MTQLGNAVIGTLIGPIVACFEDREDAFWNACRTQNAEIRSEVADEGFKQEVGNALNFLDGVQQAALVLGPLLLAAPGNAALRRAAEAAYPPALSTVSEERFLLEQIIARTLTSAEAVTLHNSLSRIDAMMTSVTAYKSMHDALHVLQPLLPLMRSAAATRPRWPELRTYSMLFSQQLARIDAAGADLQKAGIMRVLDFRVAISDALDAVDAGLDASNDYAISDATSEFAASVDSALSSVDVSMLNTAQDLNQPFALALTFFSTLVEPAKGTHFEELVCSYISFAQHVSGTLRGAIDEHGRWQKLDRQFDLLQRIVVENQPGAPGDIDRIWRLTLKDLDKLCGGQPAPDWVSKVAQLIDLARSDLAPPVLPPVVDAARDRISELISNGRSRFMAVDQSLLASLSQNVLRRPILLALLNGEGMGDG